MRSRLPVTPMIRRTAVLAVAAVLGVSGLAVAFSSWSASTAGNPGAWGNIFKGVAAVSPSDVWAVGNNDTPTTNKTLIEHFNGTSWSVFASPNPAGNCQDGNIQWSGNNLRAVAAVSSADVWAVGHGCYLDRTLIEHFNGASWAIVPSPSPNGSGQNYLTGVAAVSAKDVWAVGATEASNGAMQTLIVHFNGSGWTRVASPSPSATGNVLSAVRAVSATDIWAVGWRQGTTSQTLIEHYNGTSWSVVPSPNPATTLNQLSAVTATSANNVWAVGSSWNSSGAILTLTEHYNGLSWSVVPSPNVNASYGSSNTLSGVAAVSPSEVWAAGMFQNANTNYHQHRTLTIRWNGSNWSLVASPTPGKSGELNAIATATGKLFAVGLSSIYDINIYDQSYTAPQTLVLRG